MKNETEITGWDFSQLLNSGRMKESKLPWDYQSIVKQYIPAAESMLDMGTGGGEFLKTLAPLPENTLATENYGPNIKQAEENLKSFGVKVISGYKDESLPFKNDMFDLVINRHEYYEPAELYRILKSGGYFITQQVKGNCDKEIFGLLGIKEEPEFIYWSLKNAAAGLKKNNFELIMEAEEPGFTAFSDIDALITYLKAVSWIVPDITAEKYKEKLLIAEKIILNEGSFNCTFDRFIIIAKKMFL